MSDSKLTAAQKARIERNRQKALLLRSARLSNRPYPASREKEKESASYKQNNSNSGIDRLSSCSSNSLSRVVDTGGGFLLDAEEEQELSKPPKNLVEDPGEVKQIKQ